VLIDILKPLTRTPGINNISFLRHAQKAQFSSNKIGVKEEKIAVLYDGN
jgi:hypothetical protein